MQIKDLELNPENPRIVTEARLKMLKKALLEFGDISGVVYNTKTKRLVGGHQRHRSFPDSQIVITKKYSKPTKTGTVAEGYTEFNGEKFAYREVYWDEHKEKAANIAANKGAGTWDQERLSEWLKELSSFDLDFDLDLTMFESEELTDITGIQVGEHTRSGPTGVDEDEVPEKAPVKAQLGDIYQLGRHRLMCGDSTSSEAVEKLMDGQKADMVFTDPPYGINNDTAKGATYNNKKAFDDSQPFDLTALRFHADFVIWGGNYYEKLPLPRTKIGWVVWDKRPTRETWDQETRESADRIFGQHFEIAVTNVGGIRGKMIRKTWGGFYGTAGNPDDAIVHRTQKPIELLEHFLKPEHKLVLDYFGGSGSTLIACEKTHRKCFMMEMDPHYVDVIVTRWEKYTGKKAQLLNKKPKTKIKKLRNVTPNR